MTEPITTVDEMLTLVGLIDGQAILWEQKKLRGIRAWALKQLGLDYAEGDRVVIDEVMVSETRTPGWWHYREALAPDATAVVKKVDFVTNRDGADGHWSADIVLDREWSVHNLGPRVVRYWNGPADETPEGAIPPTKFDRDHYPDGTRHTFTVPATGLRKYVDHGDGSGS